MLDAALDYLLRALPLALLAGAACAVLRYRRLRRAGERADLAAFRAQEK